MQLVHTEGLARPGSLFAKVLSADSRCFKQIAAQAAGGRSGARPEPLQLFFNPGFDKV